MNRLGTGARVLTLLLIAAAPAVWAGRLLAPSVAFSDDPGRRALVEQSLSRRPELSQARALVEAESHRANASDAYPDPVASLGVQNGSFTEWTVGEMDTSYYFAALSQTFPWQGKRGLRLESAKARRAWSEANLERARLSTIAEVERAYVDLLYVRERLQLQDRLEKLWGQAEAAARAQYEAGRGPQADYLRAQLEVNRLVRRRYELEAAETTTLAALERLRNVQPGEKVDTPNLLSSFFDPEVPELSAAVADAEDRSPELKAARALREQSENEYRLAEKSVYPDLTVSGMVMARGNDMPTMWQLGVSAPVPVFAKRKQDEQAAEARERRNAAVNYEEVVRLTLRQRTAERVAGLSAAVKTNRLYRGGLLAQSEAATSSVIAQYRVGTAPFNAVLEAYAGYLADLEGYLQSLADARKLETALMEVSLSPAPTAGASGMSSPAGSMAPTPAAGTGSGEAQGMGGM